MAIKVLPQAFASDADRLARFQREAQVLNSLNHPNIGAIHGLEETDGTKALVLELVEGDTLAERVARGPIPVDEALPIAKQIAEALEAAHEQGIIHWDLKPANIKVDLDGRVKVLDFGLAKLTEQPATASHPSSFSMSPTITSPAMTGMGMILGTAAYMSPEQAKGRPADKRSDVWAFGCVLYELLAGKRAFDGEDVSDTLANILKSEPDWGAVAADTPPAIRRVLRRCREKDPKRRTHDVADVRLDLDEEDGAVGATQLRAKPRIMNVERVTWALLVATLAGFVAYSVLRELPSAQVVRYQIEPPEGGFFGSADGVGRTDGTSSGTVSPDGTQLVFVGTEKRERTQLWVRRFDSFTSRPLAGTDNALMPFWSPDSRSIGFYAAGKLKRFEMADGAVQTIADVAGIPRGGA